MEAVTEIKRPRTAPVWAELYVRRKSLNQSQAAAAEQIGVKQSAFSAWEAGDYPPRRRYYPKLADYLEMTTSELAAKIVDVFSPPVIS